MATSLVRWSHIVPSDLIAAGRSRLGCESARRLRHSMISDNSKLRSVATITLVRAAPEIVVHDHEPCQNGEDDLTC